MSTEALSLKGGLEYIKNVKVHPIIQSLIVHKLTTYKEIMYELELEDILNLMEILIVEQENNAIFRENSKQGSGR